MHTRVFEFDTLLSSWSVGGRQKVGMDADRVLRPDVGEEEDRMH